MRMKKRLSLLLAAAMVAVMLPLTAFAAEKPNLSFVLSDTKVAPGETITVTVSHRAMKVASHVGGFRFNKDKLTCVSISDFTLETADGTPVSPLAASTVADANADGTVAFAYAATEDTSYAAGVSVTATFEVKTGAIGFLDFTLYESSDGTNAYSAKTTKDIDTVTATLPEMEVPAVPADNATSDDIASLIKDVDKDGVIRVACVGDSITAGTNDYNYPKYLQEYLNVLGKKDGNTYVVTNHGKGSTAVRHVEETVGDLNWGWGTVVDEDGDGKAYFFYDDKAYRSSLEYTADVVIVQMGTNDAMNGDWDKFFDDDYYNYLVKPYADKGSLVVMSTPPYACNGWHDSYVNGPAHDKEVALAKKLGIPVVDTNRLLYGMDEVFADGLHGNVTGYSMMAMNFYKYVFGGEEVTLTMRALPGTRVSMVNTENNRTYSRVVDDATGIAQLSFPMGEYSFQMRAELNGYRVEKQAFTLNKDNTFIQFKQSVGGYNVAPNGIGIDCGVKVYGNNVSASLNDGERTSGGYQPDKWNEGDWCGIALDRAYLIDSIVLYWEDGSYISSFADNGYELYAKSGDNWKLIPAERVTSNSRAVYSGAIVTDTLTFEPALVAEGIKVVFLDGTVEEHKFAPKMYEMELISDNPDEVGTTPGDVDGDGEIGANDLTALARHVGKIEEITDALLLLNADVTDDGEIGADDLTRLARHVGKIEEL